MMTKIANNYKQALVEVEAVLSCLDNKDCDKILKNIIQEYKYKCWNKQSLCYTVINKKGVNNTYTNEYYSY